MILSKMSSLFCIFMQPRYQEDVKKDVLKKTFDDNIKLKLSLFWGVFPEKSRFCGFLLNQPFINFPSLWLLKGIMDSPCLLNFLINTKTKRWNLGLTPHSLETRNKKMKSQPVSMKISTIHNKISICDHENLDLSSWKYRLFIVKSRPVIMKMNSTFSRNGFSQKPLEGKDKNILEMLNLREWKASVGACKIQ